MSAPFSCFIFPQTVVWELLEYRRCLSYKTTGVEKGKFLCDQQIFQNTTDTSSKNLKSCPTKAAPRFQKAAPNEKPSSEQDTQALSSA